MYINHSTKCIVYTWAMQTVGEPSASRDAELSCHGNGSGRHQSSLISHLLCTFENNLYYSAQIDCTHTLHNSLSCARYNSGSCQIKSPSLTGQSDSRDAEAHSRYRAFVAGRARRPFRSPAVPVARHLLGHQGQPPSSARAHPLPPDPLRRGTASWPANQEAHPRSLHRRRRVTHRVGPYHSLVRHTSPNWPWGILKPKPAKVSE